MQSENFDSDCPDVLLVLSTVQAWPIAMIHTGVFVQPTSYAFPFSMPTAPGADPIWHIEYA